MANSMVIARAQMEKWQKQWNTLHEARFNSDYEMAQLLNEIRYAFPKGDSGDLQFKLWIRKNLKGAVNGRVMLARAFAFDTYDAAEWVKFGGWVGIAFLEALKPVDRKRVMAALPGEGPYHHTTVRTRAMKLGIVSRRKGRDNRTNSEQRVDQLRAWIVKLYKKHGTVLPALPAEVKAALTPTVLSQIPHEARA